MINVSDSYLESLRDRAEFAEGGLTAEQKAHNVTKQKLAQQKEHTERINAAFAAEQREHDITRRQRDTLQTQCEDMQKELKDAQTRLALDVAFMDVNDELEAERKINNAALKTRAKVLQQDQEDEMACMAEEVMSLKTKLKRSHELADSIADTNGELNQKIEALEIVEVALRTDVSRLEGYNVELQSMVETRDRRIADMRLAVGELEDSAARKAAEAKVIHLRDVWCLHSGFHASNTGGCDGCSQVPGGGCVKASEYTTPDEIAAFESLVDAYVVPDAELSPSGIEMRKKLGDSICTMYRLVVDNRIEVAKTRLEERR